MLEDSTPFKLNTNSEATCSDNKHPDANHTHQAATYFANPMVPKDIPIARLSVNDLVATPLITPLEQNDKEMPKTRRSQSVGQFPNTPTKHKVGNGNSKSLPPSRHKRPLPRIWSGSHQKEERTVVF